MNTDCSSGLIIS